MSEKDKTNIDPELTKVTVSYCDAKYKEDEISRLLFENTLLYRHVDSFSDVVRKNNIERLELKAIQYNLSCKLELARSVLEKISKSSFEDNGYWVQELSIETLEKINKV